MYSALYRMARLLRPGELNIRQHLRELERTQWLSRSELEAWQLERMQRLVQYAYDHVPYYRERYQREDIGPGDVKNLKDFQALPFLTKHEVNENLDSLVSPQFQGKLHPNETGGSTGEPMRFFVDASFYCWNVALEYRGRRWHGVQPGDKIAWVWGAPRDMPDWSWQKRLRAQIMRHRYLNAFSMTEDKMQAYADMLVRWQPDMIRAYASAVSLFGQFVKERGITGIRPKFIETIAEKVTGPQRQLLEGVFKCPVIDCYGARELGNIAYQCEAGRLHVYETRHLEIVADGEVVRPGQLGEVVVTSLTQFGMPLIRYKNDDIAIYEADDCPCGRGLPVLREVVGRTHDYLVTADGQFVHGEFFAYTFRAKPEVVRYQVYQPDQKHVQVRLVCKQNVDSTWLKNVRRELNSRFGDSMVISIKLVDDIELTPAGKYRYIISEVTPDLGRPSGYV